MKVKDIMTKDVKHMDPNKSLVECACEMRDNSCGCIPVSENDKLIGMVTDRDMVMKAIAEGKNPGTTKVREVMTPKVLYCYEDDSAEEAAQNMAKNKVRRLPVLNREKRLVGIISLGDLAVRNEKPVTQEALKCICTPD